MNKQEKKNKYDYSPKFCKDCGLHKPELEALYQLHLEGVREDYELGTEVLKISKKYADTFIALSQDMKKVAVKIEQREKLKK